jgi:hypothetical protein
MSLAMKRAEREAFLTETRVAVVSIQATGRGPVTIGRPDYERDIRRTALRYLGPQMGEMYLQATAGEREGSILVRLRPERWLSVDYRQWNG